MKQAQMRAFGYLGTPTQFAGSEFVYVLVYTQDGSIGTKVPPTHTPIDQSKPRLDTHTHTTDRQGARHMLPPICYLPTKTE